MLEHMASVAKLKNFSRVMIEYSEVDRSHTAKIRINDGRVELVAKSGQLEDETRREAALDKLDSFEDALAFMAIIGYQQAKVCIRNVFEVDSQHFNLSLRDIISGKDGLVKDSLFEVESLAEVTASNSAEIASLLDDFFKVHKLQPLAAQQWKDWVEATHSQLDIPFSYSPAQASKLANQLRAAEMLK